MPELEINRAWIVDALSFAQGTGMLADAGRAFAQGFSEELESRPTAPSRDILAAMAMQGLIAQETEDWQYTHDSDLAVRAYAIADAMLEQRSKKRGQP